MHADRIPQHWREQSEVVHSHFCAHSLCRVSGMSQEEAKQAYVKLVNELLAAEQ